VNVEGEGAPRGALLLCLRLLRITIFEVRVLLKNVNRPSHRGFPVYGFTFEAKLKRKEPPPEPLKGFLKG